tara:strand:+ start:40 stop:1506 length:1467 start_codon:yes stop_codon:yes gene_type:complete
MNITYDNPYNRNLVRKIHDNWEKTTLRNQPTTIPMRLASFHDPQAPSLMVGGGRESQYITNGNSPAYPPINMNAALQVHSGGGMSAGTTTAGAMASVDGAIGGSFWSDFGKGFKSVFKAVAPIASVAMPYAAPALMGTSMLLGEGTSGGSQMPCNRRVGGGDEELGELMDGGSFWGDFGKGFKKGFFGTAKALTAPISILAPELMPVMAATDALGSMVGEGWMQDAVKKVSKGAAAAKKFAPVAEAVFGKSNPYLNKALHLADEVQRHIPSDMRGGFSLKGLMRGATGAAKAAEALAPYIPFALKHLQGSGHCKCGGRTLNSYFTKYGHHLKGILSKATATKLGKRAVKAVKDKDMTALGDVIEDAKPYIKKVGKIVEGVMKKGRGRPRKSQPVDEEDGEGGNFFKKALKSVKKAANVVKKAAPVAKFLAPQYADQIDMASKGANVVGGARGDGRAKRAAIVKKVMRDRGVKMIEASKIVKAEGLYKK